MNKNFILKRIDAVLADADLIVLKGFSPDIILQLNDNFIILDKYILEGDKINLTKISDTNFLKDLMNLKGRAVCTNESFIMFCNCVSRLDIIPKKIAILENNLLTLYPNPTSEDIPDFDSKDFENCDHETPLYSAFYSLCSHEDGVQWVQYIDNYSLENKNIIISPLVDPVKATIIKGLDQGGISLCRREHVKNLLRVINDTLYIEPGKYLIDQELVDDPSFQIFAGAVKALRLNISLCLKENNEDITIRSELYDILKEVWGYDEFRKIKIYKNLFLSRETTEISQGEIIETVIRQSEIANSKKSEHFNNILLTAPTGAGKSLLFQLSAIYLARKYNYLTIVVSPLVALMEDQVVGLTGYKGAASLNSNKSASEKERVLVGIKEGIINLLYLSPELLLSYTISTFLGERRLGLLVVDEAHTVTTWGRDFRVDYWFLGDYIRTSRKNLGYSFPIFALTATAVWDESRRNDMVFDTIESLNMSPCIKYIGNVRRTNIKFDIRQSNISNNYEEKRLKLTIDRMREALEQGRKTIVYCPYRSTVDQLKKAEYASDFSDKIAVYHARISKDEKADCARDFKNGTRPIMCATKAFGMGIDVSDITEVYHHAPTGCLSDYVQEIGRLARDPNTEGIAKIDFSDKDFRYIRKLHGLSTIKTYQLQQVLKKLMAIYRLNGEKRNMLISADEFSYIFPKSDDSELDGNVKSALLLISHDLKNKLNFEALIVRPKSLFGVCYISVPMHQAVCFEQSYKVYLKRVEKGIYIFNAERYWKENTSSISFPQFKYKLCNGEIFKHFSITLMNKVKIELSSSLVEVQKKLSEFFDLSEKFLEIMARTRKRLKFSDIQSQLPGDYSAKDKERFIESFRSIYELGGRLGKQNKYVRVYSKQNNSDDEKDSAFQLTGDAYENQSVQYMGVFKKCIVDRCFEKFCSISDPLFAICELLSSLGLADYHRIGGEKPSIFVRVNNPHYLNKLVRNGNYQNDILNGIYEKFKYSERIFSYFFTTNMSDERRWDFIEGYFLGDSEEKLLNFQ